MNRTIAYTLEEYIRSGESLRAPTEGEALITRRGERPRWLNQGEKYINKDNQSVRLCVFDTARTLKGITGAPGAWKGSRKGRGCCVEYEYKLISAARALTHFEAMTDADADIEKEISVKLRDVLRDALSATTGGSNDVARDHIFRSFDEALGRWGFMLTKMEIKPAREAEQV